MTRVEVDQCRTDAIKIVLLSMINNFGPKHGRLLAPGALAKIMAKVRQDLFIQFNSLEIHDLYEKKFTWISLDNSLSMFECIMNFKEGPNMLDLMRLGVTQDLELEETDVVQ